jgi:dihydrofolate reductase
MIKNFTITGIAAINQQNILGIDGHMPWGKIKGDLSFYKEQTLGKTVVCGGNTFRSLPPAALKNRQTVVLTRQKPSIEIENVIFLDQFFSPGFIIEDIADLAISNEIMIVGGGLIYRVFENQYDKFYLTEINGQDFETQNKNVVYFDADLEPRSKEMKWTTKIHDWFIERNDIGGFDVKIKEMS